MFVKDVMTPSPVTCKPGDTIDRVATLMVEHDCGAVPVCEGTTPVGMITDRDITCRIVGKGKNPMSTPVSQVMTQTVHTVSEDADLQSAINLMELKQVRRLPVVDDAGKLVGIIAPSDLAPTFASQNIADFLLAVSYWKRKVGTPAA